MAAMDGARLRLRVSFCGRHVIEHGIMPLITDRVRQVAGRRFHPVPVFAGLLKRMC
jgi:hypothetical protein